jgi:UDP-N-acetylmuramoyl-tripeptide--D-alanyl-D-alanine ligase
VSEPFTAADAVRWTGGALACGDAGASFTGVASDTRADCRGRLFVAIRGAKHDAHAFLGDALAAGAAGFLIERVEALPDGARALPAIVVRDTTAALGALAAGHRARFTGPVVAITGSNGKTTTKEMCAAILSVAGPCLKNRGNLNNAWGLPLTLLEREREHRALVVEIGMNHRGEIAPLAAIAMPTVGVITNVGTAHIEHLGSREAIAEEKGDLVAGLPASATAVLNADDPLVIAQRARTRAQVSSFGFAAHADVRAEGARTTGTGFAFTLATRAGRRAVEVAGLGDPTVINALAASAAALAAGLSLDQVAEGLARYGGVSGRMERVALANGATVLNDTYNANPQSMEMALRSVARLKGRGAAIAVLGDMGELGLEAPEAHREAGALVALLGVDRLFALGLHAPLTVESAIAAGLARERARVGASHESIAAEVAALVRAGDWVLVKGSRSMKMERVVEALASAVGRA